MDCVGYSTWHLPLFTSRTDRVLSPGIVYARAVRAGQAREGGMRARGDLLLLVALSGSAAGPAAGQTAAIPDISGAWNHSSLNGLELPLSGPGPVTNRSRLPTGPQAGVSNGAELVGDYANPILQPWAADVVKKLGELSLAGKGYPTPRSQCWPEQVPFVFANYGMQILQRPDKGHDPLSLRPSIPPGASQRGSPCAGEAIMVRRFRRPL